MPPFSLILPTFFSFLFLVVRFTKMSTLYFYFWFWFLNLTIKKRVGLFEWFCFRKRGAYKIIRTYKFDLTFWSYPELTKYIKLDIRTVTYWKHYLQRQKIRFTPHTHRGISVAVLMTIQFVCWFFTWNILQFKFNILPLYIVIYNIITLDYMSVW